MSHPRTEICDLRFCELATLLQTIEARFCNSHAHSEAREKEKAQTVISKLSALTLGALACAVIAAAIVGFYLVRKPSLDLASTKIWLLLGLGVFPITAAMVGNVQGYQVSMKRSFCGDCHVMYPQVSDSDNQLSTSLSSRHGRTELFGGDNCYSCHEDYSMFGTIATKLGGMKHVWKYYTEYRNVSAEEAKKTIALYKPFENATCMHCHSTTVEIWGSVPDHKAALAAIRSDALSCASVGCHGYAHPNARPPSGL